MSVREAHALPSAAAGRPRVILCIDDDQSILRYQRRALERSGYLVVTTRSPREGLRLAMAGGFDAIIVDYHMPQLNGYEVAFAIRQIWPEMPIIMFSGGEVPKAALTVVSAFVPKDALEHFLPAVAQLVTQQENVARYREAI